jgi:hypothetical protein
MRRVVIGQTPPAIAPCRTTHTDRRAAYSGGTRSGPRPHRSSAVGSGCASPDPCRHNQPRYHRTTWCSCRPRHVFGEVAAAPLRNPCSDGLTSAERRRQRAALATSTEAVTGHGSAALGAGAGHAAASAEVGSGQIRPLTMREIVAWLTPYSRAIFRTPAALPRRRISSTWTGDRTERAPRCALTACVTHSISAGFTHQRLRQRWSGSSPAGGGPTWRM